MSSRLKFKGFKSPTEEPVRVMNHDGFHTAYVYPEWTELREDMWTSAYSQGCISKDMSRVGMNPTEAIAFQEAQEAAFESEVERVIKEILEEGDPDKIDSAGKPKVTAIGAVLGENPTAALRNKVYARVAR